MPAVLITGATGQQGSGAIDALLAQGIQVHALTRNASSLAAQSLQARGVKVFEGSYDNIPSITAAATGVDGVFLNVLPESPTGELQDAENVIAAAKAAGVTQLVYSSVLGSGWADHLEGAERAKVLPENGFMTHYWANKSAIERATRTAGFRRWTILRPGMFFSLFLAGPRGAFLPRPVEGEEGRYELKMALDPDKAIGAVHPDDIGKVVAMVLAEPERFDGKVLDVAVREVTPRQLVAALQEASGREVGLASYTQQEIDDAGAEDVLLETQLVWNRMETKADVSYLQDEGVDLRDLDQFLVERKEALMETLGGSENV